MASFRVENSLVWGRKWPRFLAAFAEVFQLDLRTAIAASNKRGRFLPRHSRFFGIICLSRKAVQAAEMDAVMPYDDPTLKEFDNYYQARSASQRERAENWAVAVFAIKYLKSMHIKATNDLFAENSWFFRNALVRANYENLLGGISRDFEPLERFFGNLMLGEKNELKSRYLLVGIKESEKGQLAAGKEGCQKKVVRKGLSEKGCQKTADKLIELIKSHPLLTQVGMSNALGISRQAVQKHLSNLKKSGRLRRVGPDKGGHWEALETL